MSKCEASSPPKRELYLVGRLNYHSFSVITYFSYVIDAQGFKQFLKVTWEPFEEQFQSLENRFIYHADIVVRLATAEHQIHSYNKEIQDKQWQEGELLLVNVVYFITTGL